MISVFDIFKIGIGPSSSHTVGPMKAGKEFIDEIVNKGYLAQIDQIKVDVYGSLALTGRGHATDTAIIMGLAGYLPDNVDIDNIANFIETVKNTKKLSIAIGKAVVKFDFDQDMLFHNNNLPLHENGMKIHALKDGNVLYSKTYYSIGGGFIVDEENFNKSSAGEVQVPYPYKSAKDLLELSEKHGISLYEMILSNETTMRTEEEITTNINRILNVMREGINRGISKEGFLPGPYKVHRRAAKLYKYLVKNKGHMKQDHLQVIDWINVYALAVNEENADGGRVVTSPTNGACGIIPAVFKYYEDFIKSPSQQEINNFFFTAGVIGSLYKMNASISGAEVGCQGEVGVACSMAAAALAALQGGTIKQIFMAAEIAMEHNLGMTCDPLAGQVQVPCIERNAVAAVKAVNAARLALFRDKDATHTIVSLDDVIETMYETGKDLSQKYRETSLGGLAIKVKVIHPCN